MELSAIRVKGNKNRMAASPRKDVSYAKPSRSSWRGNRPSSASVVSQGKRYIRSPLHEAVLNRNLQEIKKLIADGNIIDDCDDEGMSLLHHAAKNNFDDVVTLLIEKGATVDLASNDDCTPLHVALRFKRENIALTLIKNGADGSKLDFNGMSALHIAAMEGMPKIIEQLLENPKITIDSQDKKKNTALHYASAENNYESCKILLLRSASPDVVNDDGETPLHVAARENCIDIMTAIIDFKKREQMGKGEEGRASLKKYINKPRSDMKTALLLAAEMGYTAVINFLVEEGADLSLKCSRETSLLYLIASFGNLETIRSLLEKGVSHNVQDSRRRTPLHEAVRYEQMEVVMELINHGANINAEDNEGISPFMLAVKFNYPKLVSYLWDRGAKTDAKDFKLKTALHHAVESKNFDMVKFLVEICKKLIHAKDVKSHTPVHYAARDDNVQILELLKQHSKQLYEKDRSGETALHVAAKHGSVNCLRTLSEAVECKIMNCQNVDGQTALHVSIINKQIVIAKVLLQNKADADCKDRKEWTPLHHAAAQDNAECVKLLLKYKADIDSQGACGWTPLMMAAKYGNVEAVVVFLEQEAKIGLLNDDGETFFDIAIDGNQDAVCKAVLECDRWKDVMSCIDPHGKRFMAKLIKKFPHLAEIVLDRSAVFSDHHSEHPDFSVTFDYQFLEEKPQSRSLWADTVKIITQKRNMLYFAPQLMADYNREKLLAHPITSSLFSTKWYRICKKLYYTSFLFYLVYIVLMSTLIIMEGLLYVEVTKRRFQIQLSRQGCNRTRSRTTDPLSNGLDDITLNDPSSQKYGKAFGSLILIFCSFQILTELVQLIALREKYFKNLTNYFEVALYALSLYYMKLFFTLSVVSQEQSQIGVICMFLGWVNTLLYLQRIKSCRLYIVMYLKVSFTIVKLLFIFGIIILAFSFTFYLLFIRQISYINPFASTVKVLVMLTGEFDFEDTISSSLEKTDSSTGFLYVPFPVLSYVLFAIFVFLGAVAFTNLLIGLAVGDIDQIRKLATVTIYEQELEFIDGIHGILPQYLLKRIVYVPSRVHAVNKKTKLQRLKQFLLSESSDKGIKQLYTKKNDFKPRRVMAKKADVYKKISSESKTYEVHKKLLTERSSLLIDVANGSKDDPYKA